LEIRFRKLCSKKYSFASCCSYCFKQKKDHCKSNLTAIPRVKFQNAKTQFYANYPIQIIQKKKPDENVSSKKYIAFFKHLGLCAVLVFLWLENQTILLIMQYNFCFAFGNVFYLTN